MFRLCLFLRGKDQPIRSRNIRGSCEATPGKTKDPSRSKMSLGDETEKLFWDIRPPTRSDERLAKSKIPRCLTAGRRAHRDDTGFLVKGEEDKGRRSRALSSSHIPPQGLVMPNDVRHPVIASRKLQCMQLNHLE